MKSPGTAIGNNWSVAGSLLIALMLASWLASLKSLVFERADALDETANHRPNILLIVADDLGYDDSTIINSTGITTPSLQSLAQSGVTFTRHYADATCTPSRVALLTGRYPERSGFRPVGIEIPAEFPTLAEHLATAGYTTYLTGKWHAGEERALSHPQHKGFAQWFGFLNQWELSGEVTDANKGSGKKPRYNDPMLRTNGGPLVLHEGHLTDILTQHTIERIEQLNTRDEPWFLYHAFLAPHHPIQPAQRYAQQFEPTPEGEYRALVTQMDDAIGRILEVVDRSNTLVVFLSDNGGTNKERNNNYPFHGKKGDTLEGAFRTPLVLSWPGHIPEAVRNDNVVMNVDIFPTLLAAAGVTNADTIDGINLWPSLMTGAAVAERARSWEVYSENVGTLNFSFLSRDGDWRLANGQGFDAQLFHLATQPNGDHNVAGDHPDKISELYDSFWLEHWQKSRLPVTEQKADATDSTFYSGLDAMRTPFRFGLTISIEAGPLAQAVEAPVTLAEQGALWKLLYVPTQGLEWRIGDSVLRDPSFEPSACNAILLSHYFEPKAHLAVREPRSQLKLYSAGILRDYKQFFDYNTMPSVPLETPTVVHYGGRAEFHNMLVGSFGDPYQPRVREQFVDIYTQLYKAGALSIVNAAYPTGRLCRDAADAT